ncbi:retrovirus-related pol polyprotein from transposon TNT 1-94 [Tanacetum coccineum]
MGNITIAMILAFTTVDKMTHNSRKFAFTLSPINYGYWKTMIELFLITNNLMDYVDGLIPCPSKTLSVTDGVSVPKENPNYPIWVSNDAHVRMLIISTISKASCRHVQEYSDALAAIGEPVKDKDLVMLVVSDTRANSHVTPDLEAMDNSEAYYGDDALYVGKVLHLSPTSQTSLESSNGQPSLVSTTSIPIPPPPTPPPPPPPPPITQQCPTNLHQNPKQQVPYNPFANHATVLPTTITKPTLFTVANNSPEWRQAIKEEYDALMKNRTRYLVPSASNTNVVDGKWVYRLKRDKNGAITRYKARFVAKGFRQQPSIDFHETFSPVVKSITIRAILSLAKYILELLQSTGLFNYNPVSSPMVTSSSLSLDDSTAFSNPVKYRQVVGSLQYVTLYRPDIAFAVNKVILILLLKLSQMLTGLEIQMIDGPRFITWTAYKQRTVSRSSTEAEYKALADTVAELTWLQALLNELGIRSSSTPIL